MIASHLGNSLLVDLARYAGKESQQKSVPSHLGKTGPEFSPGMTPASLGWGPDDKAYPDKFVVNPVDGAEMIWVPPGEFTMGSHAAEVDQAYSSAKRLMGNEAKRTWFEDQQPAHEVQITRGFWMYRHEVTNAQYRKFKPGHDSGAFLGLSLNGDRQPVVQVRWEDAVAYCKWAGGRLPTEAEWEYACRAGTTTRFWWGDSAAEAGRFENVADNRLKSVCKASPKLFLVGKPVQLVTFNTDDGEAATAPVGKYPANPFGLHDMLGNVREWCADWYDAAYYATSPRVDPPGPTTGTRRVVRGCGWNGVPTISTQAYRNWAEVTGLTGNCQAYDVGFRPCLDSSSASATPSSIKPWIPNRGG